MTATTAHDVTQTARRVANSPWTDRLARLGFCARGLVYGIVGVIALQIAWGGSDRAQDASKDGALREIAERPMGGVLLGVLAVGMAGYALWRATEAAWGKRDEQDEAKRSAKRLGSASKAGFYGLLTVSTVRFMTSGPQAHSAGGDQKEETLTARVLGWPAGQLLVGAIGLAVIGGALYVAYRGLSQKFDERLDTSEMAPATGRAVDVLGTVGLAAKGLVFGLAGFLLLKAAIDFDPDQATGLDGTLKTIAHQTYGQLLLTATAVGLIAYGLYSFVEARYRQL
jgi:hypothetical protein